MSESEEFGQFVEIEYFVRTPSKLVTEQYIEKPLKLLSISHIYENPTTYWGTHDPGNLVFNFDAHIGDTTIFNEVVFSRKPFDIILKVNNIIFMEYSGLRIIEMQDDEMLKILKIKCYCLRVEMT